MSDPRSAALTLPLGDLRNSDLALVGGKCASLGELIGHLQPYGIRVPDGFAVTAAAYRSHLTHSGLAELIAADLDDLDVTDETALAQTAAAIRKRITEAPLPPELTQAITAAYRGLCLDAADDALAVAVRSSATAEDLPDASFAGQQDTYLNIRGADAVLDACRRCFASLFTDRAIAYRARQGIDHLGVALAVAVQRLVDASGGAAGVMFSIDPETGFRDAVVIDSAWGLGEGVVAGTVDPDGYTVFKPLLDEPGRVPIVGRRLGAKAHRVVTSGDPAHPVELAETPAELRDRFTLSDDEVLVLARWAVRIEAHYGRPMDIEWLKDGATGDLFVVQARPETVESRRDNALLRTYTLTERGPALARGIAVGGGVATGRVAVLSSPEQMADFAPGSVLVTEMTDPDWVPIMQKAAALVTDRGGRTSHAAIVSRELGVPAVVGTGDATQVLRNGDLVTVACCEGDEGVIYEGQAAVHSETVDLAQLPATRTRVMLNLAEPTAAFRWWRLPADGVGLARMEFVIDNVIKIHPMALVRYDELSDAHAKQRIDELTRAYDDRAEFFVAELAHGIARIAAARHPDPVIVRMSDFKTNEYADLIGGRQFEPEESNPMLGWRGASRYHSEGYREGFALECAALRRVRERIGLRNVVAMIPFCRTVEEADLVLAEMARHGLERGRDGLQIYVMAELPANVFLADEFAKRFDGFSIGSNDLTQLVLGVDRDSAELAGMFDERDEAVRRAIAHLISVAHEHGRPVSLCGQAPSDHPEFARFLVEAGIDSMSVAPDSFMAVKRHIAAAEAAT